MKNFKEFKEKLEESSLENKLISEDFREKDLVKVGTLLTKIASKRLGAGKFYHLYNEKFKKSSGETGVGALFASDKGIMMRFNFLTNSKSGYSINQIDYWKNGKIGDVPLKTIYFYGQNIVELSDKLINYLKTNKLDESLIFERKSSQEERIAFAQKHGIPKSYTTSHKGLYKRALKDGLENEFLEELGGGIEVTKGVPETTSTVESIKKNSKRLEDGSEAIYADPNFVFDDMEEAAKTVARGKWRSLIIAGMGGIGKTYGVKQVLTKELGPYEEGPDGKWMFYEGLSTTGFGMYKLFLLNKKKLVVFDDSDSIWKDKDMINMLKIITSDSGDRTISWASNATANVSLMDRDQREEYEYNYITDLMEDPNTKMKAPSSFNFEGRFINISNMPAEKFDDAIKSRAIFINVYLAQRDVIRRMYTIKKLQGLDEDKIVFLLKLLDPEAEDALKGKGKYAGEVKYVTPEIARKNKHMNMRSLDIAEALYDAGVKNIEHMVSMYA